jgi:hypothetical protein
MCHKHIFRLPPNRMKGEELELNLISGMKYRYTNLEDVLIDIQLLKDDFKKKSFFSFFIKK